MAEGFLQIGPDGKLYVAVGENGRSALSQDLNSYLGKILRINLDGSARPTIRFPDLEAAEHWGLWPA